MTEEFIKEMYLIAVKSKLQRGAISLDEMVKAISEELNLLITATPVGEVTPSSQNICSGAGTQQTPAAPAPAAPAHPKIEKVRYGQTPDKDGFEHRDLEEALGSYTYYRISIFEGGKQATYAMLSEKGQNYLLDQSIAPDCAVTFQGSPNGGEASLELVEEGELERNGRYWNVVRKCVMKWV